MAAMVVILDIGMDQFRILNPNVVLMPPTKFQSNLAYPLGDPSKHAKSGHHWSASKTPFEWRFPGGPIVAQDMPAGDVV